MKKEYISPKADFVTFQIEDVITTSSGYVPPSENNPFTINVDSLNRDIEML